MKIFNIILSVCFVFFRSLEPNTHKILEGKIAFDYSLLSKQPISYSEIIINQFEERKFVSQRGDSVKIIKITSENPEYNISSYIYRLPKNTDPYFYRDEVEILGERYKIDSLYYGELFYNQLRPIRMILLGAYHFEFESKKYITLYVINGSYPSSASYNLILLFDVTNSDNIKFIHTDFQASENPLCFGDFNQDHKLDFAYWYPGLDTLRCYMLDDEKFELVKEYFLSIKEEGFRNYQIQLDKSNWFFNINEK